MRHPFNMVTAPFLFLLFLLVFPSNANLEFQPPSTSPPPVRNLAPFKPSIAVIVAVLTTMFSVTFLLLLYAKHCKRGAANANGTSPYGPHNTNQNTLRKNSGIERAVIDSLPFFRFSSLKGQKDGLECAVCLGRFEPAELLRLLPKCKHAFHVECVDTWLDAHSTCPLCRYRVDPEDILLMEDGKMDSQSIPAQEDACPPSQNRLSNIEESIRPPRRVSGRHSSAGEKASEFLQIVLQKPGEKGPVLADTESFRRSLDSSTALKNTVSVGCFDRQRKDGLLLEDAPSFDRSRFEHCIIVSGSGSGSGSESMPHHRWSDVYPSEMLYLRSEMIINDSRRVSASSGSRPSVNKRQSRNIISRGRSGINWRSVSEISGLRRFSSNSNRHQYREGRVGVASRWLAWRSQLPQPAVRSGCKTNTVASSALV